MGCQTFFQVLLDAQLSASTVVENCGVRPVRAMNLASSSVGVVIFICVGAACLELWGL